MKLSRVEKSFATMEPYSFAGIAVGICFEAGAPAQAHFSYSQDFLTAYEKEGLATRDGTLAFGFSTDRVALWSEIQEMGFPKEAFEFAASYGMEEGICFSTTVSGRKTIGSISLQKGQNLSTEERQSVLNALDLATLEMIRFRTTDTNLSDKSLAYLRHCRDGVTEKDMTALLGLSIQGVRARRHSMLKETGCDTVPQAVALASNRTDFWYP